MPEFVVSLLDENRQIRVSCPVEVQDDTMDAANRDESGGLEALARLVLIALEICRVKGDDAA